MQSTFCLCSCAFSCVVTLARVVSGESFGMRWLLPLHPVRYSPEEHDDEQPEHVVVSNVLPAGHDWPPRNWPDGHDVRHGMHESPDL